MYRAQSYIFRQVLVSTLFVTVTLTAVIWLTQAIRFIRLIVNKGLPLDMFLYVTSLLLPSFLLITLPLGLFFATLFTLNKLTNDRELVVLRGAGISHLGLAWPVMALAFLCTAVSYSISLYVMPVTFQEFRRVQHELRTSFSAGVLQEGTFNSVGNGITMYVRSREGNTLQGILVQDNRKPELPVTMMAQRGAVVTSEAGPRVLLINGNRQEYDRKAGRLSVLHFAQYSFEINLGANNPDAWREPAERFLGQLLFPDESSANDRFYRGKLIAEGHNRIVAPLYGLALPLLALLFLLPGQFNKRGQTWRLVVATGAAAGAQATAIGLLNAAAKTPLLIPFMYLNPILPMIFVLWVLAGAPGWNPRRWRASGAGAGAA